MIVGLTPIESVFIFSFLLCLIISLFQYNEELVERVLHLFFFGFFFLCTSVMGWRVRALYLVKSGFLGIVSWWGEVNVFTDISVTVLILKF